MKFERRASTFAYKVSKYIVLAVTFSLSLNQKFAENRRIKTNGQLFNLKTGIFYTLLVLNVTSSAIIISNKV